MLRSAAPGDPEREVSTLDKSRACLRWSGGSPRSSARTEAEKAEEREAGSSESDT